MKNNLHKYRGLVVGAGFWVLLAIVFGINLSKQEAQEVATEESVYEKFSRSDSITEAVRDRNTELWRVRVKSPTDLEKVKRIGTVVEDYGSMIIFSRKKGVDIPESGLQIEPLKTEVNLPFGKFEPIVDSPSNTIKANSPSPEIAGGKDYFIVQLAALTKDEWLRSFEEVGAEVVQYIPHQAFFVYGNGDVIQKIADHSRVRWVGRYKPEHKISPQLNEFSRKAESEKATYEIAVFSRADLDLVKTEIQSTISGRILVEQKLQHNFFNLVRVEMSPAEIERVSRLKHVIRIDPYVKAVAEDERAAQIVSGNYSNTTTIDDPGYNPLAQFGVDGTNVTVAISDDGVSIPGNGGFYITAANTIDGPLRGATSGADGGHGHINASIVAGGSPFGILDPTGYNYGRGVAPNAHIINIPFLKSGNTTTDAQSVDDTVSTAGPNGVNGSIINNSWGAGTNGNSYDSRAAAWDGYVRDASSAGTIDRINVVFSAGNSGSGGLTRPKMAKNVIAVGNSENLRTEIGGTSANNIDDMRSSSSRGPAADGRIKPDITAPGTYIAGSRGGSGTSVSGHIDANHSFSIGTSHAAPQIAGVAALFTEFWKNNNSGVNPSPALVKAAILNTGQEMNGVGSSSPLPNGDEGWGRVNLKYMLNTGVPMKFLDEPHIFTGGGSGVEIIGRVADVTKPVLITLVWTDPPGVSDPALVNDLDLQVNVNGNFYLGNNFSNGVSVTGGTADTVNNVEVVRLPAGTPANSFFSVSVVASAINGDGVLGNADPTDQNYALAVYNFQDLSVPTTNSFMDFNGDDKTDISIFRPGPGEWWYLNSSNNMANAFQFGQGTDQIASADFTGDGKTDIAFFRPGSGEWFILRSEDNSFFSFPFGTNGDIPVPADYDGDGIADPAIFRPSNNTWFILNSSGGTTIKQFGTGGDLPVPTDYDGDGKADIGIFRPSLGQWWIDRSQDGLLALTFGQNGDKTVPADYTGDAKADIAFFRPSSNEWFILRSEDFSFFSVPFGASGDIPTPGDYDGDGTADFAIFRPSNQTWFLQESTNGFRAVQFGIANDVPVPNAYVR